LAIRWPAKIKPDSTPRAQFLHVNDVVPTIYDILGITPPRVVNGIPQDSFDGVSFASTFNDAYAKVAKHTQYFDIMGSRGIYHDGWMASAAPTFPRMWSRMWQPHIFGVEIDVRYVPRTDIAAIWNSSSSAV
jgi:arylsulfatase A-like enzyme